MPQDPTTAPPPMDIQVDDVWLCGDGVTKRTIAAIDPNIVRYPVRCTCGACYTDDGRYWQLKGRTSSLDLVKLISRNGSPVN